MHRELPVINYNFNGINEVIDPNEDIEINIDNLLEECSQHSAKFAFFGNLDIDFEEHYKAIELLLKTYEAEKEPEMRERILARYGEKERITEAKLEAEFIRDNGWNEINKKLMEARANSKRLNVIKEAFKQRSQQLWNTCMLRSKESDNFVGSNK